MENRSKPRDFRVEFDQGGSVSRRRTALLRDGSYLFEDQLEIEGLLSANVVTCTAWLIEFYNLTAGELFFSVGTEQVRPTSNHCGVFYPPFSITEPSFKDTKASLVGIASSEPLATQDMAGPTLFEFTELKIPAGAAEAIKVLRTSRNHRPVPKQPAPSVLSQKAKNLLDESYLVYPSIARIAARLGVTHEHLSRQFKRDFGISPSTYLRQLRVADVPLKLARGEDIIEISFDVGYNDLSRFYKQFRKTTHTSPGACKSIMRPSGT